MIRQLFLSKINNMKKITLLKLAAGSIALLSVIVLINSCNKDKTSYSSANDEIKTQLAAAVPATQNQPLVKVMSVANISNSIDGTSFKVVFNQNAEIFSVQEGVLLSSLRQALTSKSFVKVTFDPWQASIIKVEIPTAPEVTNAKPKQVAASAGVAMKIDLETMSKDAIDNMERIAVINRSTPGLTNVVPDMATAQSMFDYISKQC